MQSTEKHSSEEKVKRYSLIEASICGNTRD